MLFKVSLSTNGHTCAPASSSADGRRDDSIEETVVERADRVMISIAVCLLGPSTSPAPALTWTSPSRTVRSRVGGDGPGAVSTMAGWSW
ncbi:hypothetical protein ACWGE1_02825 [Streptomyces sp. NPDC054932]